MKTFSSFLIVGLVACSAAEPSVLDAGAPALLSSALAVAAEDTEPRYLDETVEVPWLWPHRIVAATSHGGKHYVVSDRWLSVLDDDGTPVDRLGFPLEGGDFDDEDDVAVAVGGDRLVIAYRTSSLTIRVKSLRLVDGRPLPDETEVTISGGYLFDPALAFDGSHFWLAYAISERPRYHLVVRDLGADGQTAAPPRAVATVAVPPRLQAVAAGDHVVLAYASGDGAAVVDITAGRGIGFDGTVASRVSVAADTSHILLIHDRVVRRMTRDLVAAGPVLAITGATYEAWPSVVADGFRVVWHDSAAGTLGIRDIPTAAAAGPERLLAAIPETDHAAVSADGRTLLVHPTLDVPPSVTRLGAGDAVEARTPLRSGHRRDGFPSLAISEGHLAATWARSTSPTSAEAVMAPVSAAGELLAAPRPRPESSLVPRAGGFWQVARGSIQALDPMLVPVGDPVAIGDDEEVVAGRATTLLVGADPGGVTVRIVDARGDVVVVPRTIGGIPARHAVAAGDDEWLFAWCEAQRIRAQRLGFDGHLRDAAPRDLAITGQRCTEVSAVHVAAGRYTLAFERAPEFLDGIPVWTVPLAVSGYGAPRHLFTGGHALTGPAYDGSVRLVADGDTTLVVRSGFGLPRDAFRLGADGAPMGWFALAADAIARTAQGRFLVLAQTNAPAGERVMRHELILAAPGTTCTTGFACASGYCVDGVCCDRACGTDTTDCEACSAARGAAVDGVCGPRVAGEQCRAATDVCHVAAVCDGVSATCPANPGNDGATCDDGQACTTGDVCRDGACAGVAVECADPGECRTAWCEPGRGCRSAPVDDGTACSAGQCAGGDCVAIDAGVTDAALPDPVIDAGPADARPADAGSTDARSPSVDDSGCSAAPGGASWLLLALAAFAARTPSTARRRRPRRRR